MILVVVLFINIIGLIIANPLPADKALASGAIPNLLDVINEAQLNADVQARYVRTASSYVKQFKDGGQNGQMVGDSVRIKRTSVPHMPPHRPHLPLSPTPSPRSVTSKKVQRGSVPDAPAPHLPVPFRPAAAPRPVLSIMEERIKKTSPLEPLPATFVFPPPPPPRPVYPIPTVPPLSEVPTTSPIPIIANYPGIPSTPAKPISSAVLCSLCGGMGK